MANPTVLIAGISGELGTKIANARQRRNAGTRTCTF